MTIEISDKAAAILASRAASTGRTVEQVVEDLALQQAHRTGELDDTEEREKKRALAVAGIREFQKHVKPDPDGWTIEDYIRNGRR